MTPTSPERRGSSQELDWPVNGGTIGWRIRRQDWSGSALGPIEDWPESLKGLVEVVLDAPTPMALAWGTELSLLFNDAWLGLAFRAENSLGGSARTEPTAPWPVLASSVSEVMAEGFRLGVCDRATRLVYRLAPVFAGGDRPAGVIIQTADGPPKRLEWLSFALGTGQIAVWDWDLTAGAVEWSPGVYRLHGHGAEAPSASYELWASRVHPEDLPRVEAAIREAHRSGELYESTYRIVWPDGSVRWCASRAEPLMGLDGRPVRMIGIDQDVTEHRAAVERQKVLLGELQHRVRNTLSVIRSIMRRTAETSEGVEHFTTHFEGRIDALARVQTLLVRDPDARLDLEVLLREELRAAAAEKGDVEVEGPIIHLASKAGETMSLTFHELTTNALKFGALGREGGRLSVRWTIERGEPVPELRLVWRETGVTGLEPPTRSGFGMELLKRTIPYDYGGRASVEFAPEGLTCRIALPVTPRIWRPAPADATRS